MNGSGRTEIAEWTKNHLWHIGAAIAVAYSGYLTGQMTMQAEIDALRVAHSRDRAEDERRLESIERRLNGRFVFLGQAVPIINLLCGQNQECRTYYGRVEMPQ